MASKKCEPELLDLPAQRMAVVYTVGDPNVVGEQALPALYGAAYTLKFALKKQGIEFKVDSLRARWPDAHLVPKEQWHGQWGVPIPADTTELTQKVPGVSVVIETWEYGTVAQILHLGPYSEEGVSVQRLHDFIAQQGYEITGVHEEIYLTRPTAKVPKTIIRYAVRKRDK